MEANEILDRFQKKIIEINKEANEALKRLSEREAHRYTHVKNMYDCDEDYYRNVARFAWAERSKQIAMIEMQSFLNELKEELQK